MKWLIYLLLVANLSWFAWHSRSVPGDVSARVLPAADGVPGLQLLSETTPAPASPPPSIPAPVPSVAITPESRCYRLGPFAAAEPAAAARARLEAAGWSVHLQVDDSLRRDGYWVMLPSLRSRAAALEVIAMLKRRGVEDYFLIAAGDHKNGISLGVFSERARAERRLASLRPMGLSPRLETVELPQRRFWLESEKPYANTNADALLETAGRPSGVQVVPGACPTA